MNLDAILAFGSSLIAAAFGAGLIHPLPAEATIWFADITKVLAALGVALHLDGK